MARAGRSRFGEMMRELQHPGLLYLAALMHDTGKARSGRDHAQESMRMAGERGEPAGTGCIRERPGDGADRRPSGDVGCAEAGHLRRGDGAGLRGKVQTPEALRMLTLFTYADINAVHPDALTPWKAENLWRLYIATANYLDRNVDEERVGRAGGERTDRIV